VIATHAVVKSLIKRAERIVIILNSYIISLYHGRKMASSTLLSNFDFNYWKLAQVSLIFNPSHPQASQMSHVES
jgi:hypothetical protein